MSLALTKAAHLAPEIRLAQAISEFEADLVGEEKTTFRNAKRQSSRTIPSMQDVMILTAQIDQSATRNGNKGRCFGPRFTNVLQAVQKFASLGDIMVGGSQNLIACAVWTVVRTGLLVCRSNFLKQANIKKAITNTASLLDKISSIFMALGTTAPRYEKLALLYPKSSELHNLLCEYYIGMVKLCQNVVRWSRKSTLGSLVSSFNDSDLSACKAKLDQTAIYIREELQVLTAQTAESELIANSKFRYLSLKMSKTAARDYRLRRYMHFLELCSSYDHEIARKQYRRAGTTTIQNQLAAYQEWISHRSKPSKVMRLETEGPSYTVAPTSTTLIIKGKLGSGKSVLMANIIDDLNLSTPIRNCRVLYFFCSPHHATSLRARTILGSLVRQLFQSEADLERLERYIDILPNKLDLEYLEDLLIAVLTDFNLPFEVKVVLDGLHECQSQESLQLLSILKRVQERYSLLICVSERTESIEAIRELHSCKEQLIPDDNPEVTTFLEAELQNCIAIGKLKLGNPNLALEIYDRLFSGAQGMFLWVVLQLECLCQENTDAAIRLALQNLPKTLSEIFSRILSLHAPRGTDTYQKRILELVSASRRPLGLDELRVALSVVPGNILWSVDQLVNDVKTIIASCGGLLTIDEEDLTVQVVHHSVRQFLYADVDTQEGWGWKEFDVQKTMADIIITYLSYKIFDRQLVKYSAALPMESIPNAVIQSIMPSSMVRDLALRLLKNRKENKTNFVKTFRKSMSDPEVTFAFLQYAKDSLGHHAWTYAVAASLSPIYNLLTDYVGQATMEHTVTADRGIDDIFLGTWDSPIGFKNLILNEGLCTLLPLRDKENVTLFEWSVDHRYNELTYALLCSIESAKQENRTAAVVSLADGLLLCLQQGRYDLAQEILDVGYPVNDLVYMRKDNEALRQETMLSALVMRYDSSSHGPIAERIAWLLQRGANPFSPFKFAPLHPDGEVRFVVAELCIYYASMQTFLEYDTLFLELMSSCQMQPVAWLLQHGFDARRLDRKGSIFKAVPHRHLLSMIGVLLSSNVPDGFLVVNRYVMELIAQRPKTAKRINEVAAEVRCYEEMTAEERFVSWIAWRTFPTDLRNRLDAQELDGKPDS